MTHTSMHEKAVKDGNAKSTWPGVSHPQEAHALLRRHRQGFERPCCGNAGQDRGVP